MSDIPLDIMYTAANWTAKCYQPKTGTWFDVRDNIARAIHAERERCADVARSYFNSEEYGAHHRAAGYAVSVAIVSGEVQ